MNDEIKEVTSPVDYAVLMKEVLVRLQDGIKALPADVNTNNLNNLVVTALDYMFYLEDNRRVII